MDILNPKNLRQKADMALRRGREPKKLIYYYAGISLALSLGIFLANLWLDRQISGTGGLGDIGTRAMLGTAQQAIPVLASLLSLCLDLGFLAGLMRISRGQYADHTDLKTGFRKFWPLMRLNCLQMLLYFAVAFLAVQVSSLIFSFTPWAEPLMEVVMPLAMSGATEIDEAVVMQVAELMMPMLILLGIVLIVLLLPLLFRIRMALFCLLDDPKGRAMAAIRESSRMMRRRFGQMLKIDLRLWMYYAASAVSMLVLWADVILAMLGIPFPMEAELFAGVLFGVSLLIQTLCLIFLRPAAEMTYLAAYDALREKKEDSGVVLGNIFDM
jgi:uncharacterized membrane protein